jgi:hypothetical protein
MEEMVGDVKEFQDVNTLVRPRSTRVVDMKGDDCIAITADMTVTIGQTYEIVDNNTCQCASCLGDVIPRISVFESCGFD